MVKAGKLLANQEGVIPLYQQAQPQLVKPGVKGIQAFPTAPLWDWSKVTVK
ncbi:oligopeptide ABC transporter, periplasmic oligopeptide-binding protein OppA [Lentilactobacillus farraginis DSM 18382 = JCM 14108]|nr:oligopeptide ABC transporter, periplasmic oligopeptide-binding protein OppA [Lentilactobacillus farraginis DSM 18382 = JCM 14108]